MRLDSYQTESDFVVSVMAKNLKKEEVSVDFGGENVSIIFLNDVLTLSFVSLLFM